MTRTPHSSSSIVQSTHEGLAAARARGVRPGRPLAMTPEQIRHARPLLAQPEETVFSIAHLLNVNHATTYTYVPEMWGNEPSWRSWSASRSAAAAGTGTCRSPRRSPCRCARPCRWPICRCRASTVIETRKHLARQLELTWDNFDTDPPCCSVRVTPR